jgi:hypothetical protein
MSLRILVVCVALATSGWRQLPSQSSTSPDRVALIGVWQLDLRRTHYGPGVDRRRSEQMRCDAHDAELGCTIRSVRADGRNVTARFTAPLSGGSGTVTGLADIDTVNIRPGAGGLVDATFSYRGQPRFGYRAYRSADGNSLFILAVDPVTRIALTTLVVYRRATTAVRTALPRER